MKASDFHKQQKILPSAKTVALIGSATYAAKARDALAAAAIHADVVKQGSSRAHKGCIYGISFSSSLRVGVAFVLDRAGITVREYLEEQS